MHAQDTRPTPEHTALWTDRAKSLLEQALVEWDSTDAIPVVAAAQAALRIALGELPEGELDGWFDDDAKCICPSDLRERGGFTGGCPVHGITITVDHRPPSERGRE